MGIIDIFFGNSDGPKTAEQHNAQLTGSTFRIVNRHIPLQIFPVRAQQNGWLQCAVELEKILNAGDDLILSDACRELIKRWNWAGKLGR